jgi:Cu+-exporting ATPase
MAGMEVIVKPGQRLPCDGRIMEGHPAIDESLLTGESVPVPKQPGDTVIGGSLNTNRPFRYKATAGVADSYLSQVIHLVAEAQARKAPVQRLADRVAAVFVPIVLLIAIVTGLAWHFLAPGAPLLIKSVVSVLIIACPCALGLATPTAILAGSGRAARDGIIIRGGDVLENLTKVDTAILDKTGTLTHGRLEVAEVIPLGETSRMELIKLVGSAEISSEHPLGKAIVKHMQENQIDPVSVWEIETTPGMGLSGKVGGHTLLVGNRALMKANKVDIEPALERARQEMDKGRTVVLAALEGELIGVIALADRLRSEARDIIAWMQERFGRVVMISGDTYQTTRGVARSLKLEDFEAEVKPDQKQLVVEAYRKAGYHSVMVGDGVNDAPALAAADVGIAVGSGTDVAIQSAGVVIYGDDLNILKGVFYVARTTMKVVKQNLFWAFFYNVLAIPVAAGVLYPITGLTLSPMIAATAMAFSSVFVVTNSLRLSRLQTATVSPVEPS